MQDPARAERQWLAVAIATWWLLSVGGEADTTLPVTMEEVPQTQRRRPRWRSSAIFQQGWIRIVAALLCHEPLPFGKGKPEPWPQTVPRVTSNSDDKPPG